MSVIQIVSIVARVSLSGSTEECKNGAKRRGGENERDRRENEKNGAQSSR